MHKKTDCFQKKFPIAYFVWTVLFVPINAFAQESPILSYPIMGNQKYAIADFPARLVLPDKLKSLIKDLNDRSSRTNNEWGACLVRSESSSSSATDLIVREVKEGNSFSYEGCGATDVELHTHPANEKNNYFHSGPDFSNFIRYASFASVVTNPDGVCVLVKSKKLTGRMLPPFFNIEYGRYSFALPIDLTSAAGKIEPTAIAAAARYYSHGLYCGQPSGVLDRVSAPVIEMEKTDIMIAKGIIIMMKVAARKDWPPLTFNFTPELDDAFIKYVNERSDSIVKPLSSSLTTQQVVHNVIEAFYDAGLTALHDKEQTLGLAHVVTIPATTKLAIGDPLLGLGCFTSKEKRLTCVVNSDVNSLTDAGTSAKTFRVFASYVEGKSHSVIEYHGMRPPDYKPLDKDVNGTGYIDNSEHTIRGQFRDHAPHGKAEFLIKATGQRYRATFLQGKIQRETVEMLSD